MSQDPSWKIQIEAHPLMIPGPMGSIVFGRWVGIVALIVISSLCILLRI